MRSRICRWTASTSLFAMLLAPAAGLACVGDCNDDRRVTIDELMVAVGVSLGDGVVDDCDAVDNDRDRGVTINELVRAVGRALDGCGGGPADVVLLNTQDDQLDEYDLAGGAVTTAVPSTRAEVYGQACLLPGGAGDYAVGLRDPDGPGWGVFSADGTFLRRLPLPPTDLPPPPGEVAGCAVDGAGRLFGTYRDTGVGGRLVVYFPPDYGTGCTLDLNLHLPGMPAIDAAGSLYVPDRQPATVQRFSPPFPADVGQCSTVAPSRGDFITDLTAGDWPLALARNADGHFFLSSDVAVGPDPSRIREYSEAGTFVRDILPPGHWGDPASLAFDADGTLYYADRGRDAAPGTGTIRRVAFDGAGDPGEPELMRRGLTAPDGLAVLPSRAEEWLTLGGSVRRTYFNPRERQLNAETAPRLINKWRYLTSGMISAQAVVTWVDLPGEGRTQIVIFSSWDRYLYALRTDNGSLVWRYLRKPQPGTFYPWAGTPTIAWIDGQQRVFAPGGETMYCLDAATGAELWQFDAGTGCTTCTTREERNQIESTPAVANGLVFFSMDVNDNDPGKGGVYAVDARDGRLVWFFDLFSGGVCRPHPTDEIRRYDGYHDAEALGLPADFFATRAGCDHPRIGYGCGNVWSSPALDLRRGLLFTASSNCDTDDDPNTPEVAPPMPPHDEALFALHLDGSPAWIWRPREEDNDDLAFGAVPNLFEAEIGGATREVVGIGNKDGTYYVLDRDGVNQITGRIEPYWATNVVPGGPIGGVIASASVGEGAVVFSTGFGFSISRPQKPSVHALNADDGSIRWQDSAVDTSYAPCMGVPGLALCGGTPRPNINIFDRVEGPLLRSVQAAPVPSGVAAGATVVGGQLFVGAGTGAFNEGSDAEREAMRDTPLSAFCIEGTPGCAPNTCTDGNACTYDYRDRTGTCVSEPGAEGLDCRSGAVSGACRAGVCVIPEEE